MTALLNRLKDRGNPVFQIASIVSWEKGVPVIGDSHNLGSSYIPTLDGWRAVAVLAVIVFHCWGNGDLRGRIWYSLASRGNAGVDIFFALSGFLICGKLLSEQRRTHTIALKQFYLRRSFRILPALGVYLIVLAALDALGYVKVAGWEFASTLLYARNWFPLFDTQVLGRFTAHFWSLAVEEHFYLLWPPLMLLLGPKQRRIGLAALGLSLAVFVWRCLDSHYGWLVPYGTSVAAKTDTRIDALLWGCLAAIAYPYIQPRLRASLFGRNIWLPIAVVLACVLFLKQLPGGTLIKAILFPALVISTAISPDSALGRILEFGFLRWIGRLSYSIYIWQQLLIFRTISPNSPLRPLQHFPVNIAVVFLLSAASYYLIEKKLIRVGRKLARNAGRGVRAEARDLPATTIAAI